MRSHTLTAMVGLAVATGGAGCGRSVVFQLFVAAAETSGGTSGGETSGGHSTGAATTGSSATGRTSGSSAATSGGSSSAGASTGGTSGGASSAGTASGGTTSGASSGSSSSGGTTGPQCQPNVNGQPVPDLPTCNSSADCLCPTECVFDPVYQQQDCEFPCQSAANCPFIETACAPNGFCPPNPCGGSDGSQNGSLDGICAIAGQGPGSCVPVLSPQGFEVNLCLQGGETFGSCVVAGQRSEPTEDCAAGLVCLLLNTPACQTLCNPFGPNTCAFQQVCTQPEPNDPLLGICTLGSGSSGGSTGGGTSSGGNSGGTGGQPVCDPSIQPVEFDPCTTVADCGCPMVCVFDPLAVEGGQGQVCEYPCAQLSQCPDLLTSCNGKACQLTACGGGTGNGSYNSFCSVVSANDGSCIPFRQANGTTYGVCAQGGSATTACNYDANRSELSQDCAAGMVCIGGGIGSGGVCGDVCDPNQGGPCPPGQDCAFTVDNPLAGACYTP